MMSPETYLLILILAPMLAAVGGVLRAAWARPLGLLTAAINILALIALVNSTNAILPMHYPLGGWEAPLGINFYIDGLSLFMLILSVIVGSAILLYAGPYFEATDSSPYGKIKYFYPLFLFTWTALNTTFISGDLFNWYVTLELLTLTAAGLVALSGKRVGIEAAFRYLSTALVASMLYLSGRSPSV